MDKLKKDMENKSKLIHFYEGEEMLMLAHYKKVAIDLNTDVEALIKEAMEYYAKLWKPSKTK